ncbi:arsenic transporter [Marmoricola endophyticus]|uniref:Arsenic transporter n=1 Tax=Marmoricola endophyticus TaxID=2040280 RepID=A0A917BPY3_9ACTN|nr:SLC13 family permease [Marmoricola endophyticus]GGF54363.1 arsenic transporter [Marmoricola endophyticus]
MTTDPVLAEVGPLVALVALLAVAFRSPRTSVEVGTAALATAVCLPFAGIGHARDAVLDLLPVVVFLAAILVVAGRCAAEGLFDAVGARLGRGSPTRFLTAVFVAAVAVTAVLSLDATVVLLTLVVLAAARRAGVLPEPGLAACVRLANSSSLLLPVSNLTTLLALKVLPLSFSRFALVMAPTWLVVVAVEYVVHRLRFRRALPATAAAPTEPPAAGPLPCFPLAVLTAMLVGFVLAPLAGLADAWGPAVVAVVAALALTAADVRRTGARTLVTAFHESSPGFVVFVLALGVVVDAVGRGGLGDVVDDLARGAGGGLGGLLVLALLATVLANVVNNLPATLLLLPAVAPLGTTAVLATLVGLNVGSSLTWSGSLANLLWRRTLVRAGERPSTARFHALSAMAVPPGLVLGVVALWLWAPIVL